jgi:SAM-dependent methyltransferase
MDDDRKSRSGLQRIGTATVASLRRAVSRPLAAGCDDLGPASKNLMSVVGELAGDTNSLLLDAGCGYGRNAVALASHGLSVVCADQKLERLNELVRLAPKHIADLKLPKCKAWQLYPLLADLDPAQWPFRENCFAGIICVHFLNVALFKAFRSSLVAGGGLYIETFGGQGGNYLDLPKAGQLRDMLSKDFDLPFYREKKVGPPGYDAVTVKLFARKRFHPPVSTSG